MVALEENAPMTQSYEEWMKRVRATFESLSLPAADWQAIGAFDYRTEYDAGVSPEDAATKANHQWWREWNQSLNQDCRETQDCWLPRGHEGRCQRIGESRSG
jgi:hypothetical protein